MQETAQEFREEPMEISCQPEFELEMTLLTSREAASIIRAIPGKN